jgi:hypothetical protein
MQAKSVCDFGGKESITQLKCIKKIYQLVRKQNRSDFTFVGTYQVRQMLKRKSSSTVADESHVVEISHA